MTTYHWRRRLALASCLTFAFQTIVPGAHAATWINEFHYDNTGTDTGEFIELAGTAGESVDGWTLQLYNGTSSQRSVYRTINLSGTFTDQTGGVGFQVYNLPTNGLQNGSSSNTSTSSPDGFALVDNNSNVIEFLSYEGSFTAASGPAAGMTSTDVGVRETGSTPVGFSLQLTGDGDEAVDFTWAAAQADTPGAVNAGQTISGNGGGPVDPPPGPEVLAIYEIQGAGHTSPFESQTVETSGIVTGLTDNGFFVQDPVGDDDLSTSDGLFVFTDGVGNPEIGDEVTLTGQVDEFFDKTQLSNATIEVESKDNTLPTATVIGTGGRVPPNTSIDSDPSTFDPDVDGRDFYESLEGMAVVLPDAQAVSNSQPFGQIMAVGDHGTNSNSLNAFGGVTIEDGDLNPERVQIDDNGFTSVENPNVGDKLGDINGHIDFSFGEYEILASSDVTVTQARNNTPEVTNLVSGPQTLTVATFNALLQDNFNQPGQDQIDGIAAQIVENMQSPDIIGLQELQVDFANGGANALLDAIEAAGGPRYELAFVDSNSSFNTTSIQTAFLYNPEVATLENAELLPNGIPDSNNHPFDGGQRVPLVATFSVGDEEFTIVNNHFDSKGGSDPLFGSTQPPANGGEADREAQAALVNEFVDGFLATDPDANVLVLGDFNAFSWEAALEDVLEGDDDVLDNLEFLVDDQSDRFTFNFQGNAQALDHIYANDNIIEGFDLGLDYVHINSLFTDGASDHDPVILSISVIADPIPLPAAFWVMFAGAAGFFGFGRRKT
ncbi:MAG: endonuclease/exonuclease/phosphatase family protein [Pseudomonadota bacterium]